MTMDPERRSVPDVVEVWTYPPYRSAIAVASENWSEKVP